MKSWYLVLALAAFLSVSVQVASVQAGLKPPANRWWRVVDDHNGRPGGTKQEVTFQTGDKNYHLEYGDQCRTSYANYGHFFLGGFAFGHPDPRIKDPKATCGHGIATLTAPPETGTPPLLIMPAIALVDPDSEAPLNAVADATDVIRQQLPRIDKPEGDKLSKVIELRKVVNAADAAKALKNVPKRTPQKPKD